MNMKRIIKTLIFSGALMASVVMSSCNNVVQSLNGKDDVNMSADSIKVDSISADTINIELQSE